MLASIQPSTLRRSDLTGGSAAPADPVGSSTGRALRAPDATAAPASNPAEALERASRAAIGEMFAGRDVSVASFHDDASGRMVYRVTDPHSGEVLMQQPTESLLRLYASGRTPERPLLAIEA